MKKKHPRALLARRTTALCIPPSLYQPKLSFQMAARSQQPPEHPDPALEMLPGHGEQEGGRDGSSVMAPEAALRLSWPGSRRGPCFSLAGGWLERRGPRQARCFASRFTYPNIWLCLITVQIYDPGNNMLMMLREEELGLQSRARSGDEGNHHTRTWAGGRGQTCDATEGDRAPDGAAQQYLSLSISLLLGKKKKR